MNCQAIQNKILALPDPRRVPDSLRDHVAECAACRVWAEQAGRLESLLERLPVPPPPADKKAATIDELHRAPALAEPAVATREERLSPFRRFLNENATLVGGLAAAVVVAVAAWSFYPKTGPQPEMARTPEYPLLKNVTQRQVALANADTPTKKLRALGGLADDLSAEARGLARVASADELQDIARWYGQVKDSLVTQAQNIPPLGMDPVEKKGEFEALAKKMGQTAAEVEKVAAEVSPDAKPALDRIVGMARDGEKKFQALAEK
jgi:hypothetical protein